MFGVPREGFLRLLARMLGIFGHLVLIYVLFVFFIDVGHAWGFLAFLLALAFEIWDVFFLSVIGYCF